MLAELGLTRTSWLAVDVSQQFSGFPISRTGKDAMSALLKEGEAEDWQYFILRAQLGLRPQVFREPWSTEPFHVCTRPLLPPSPVREASRCYHDHHFGLIGEETGSEREGK